MTGLQVSDGLSGITATSQPRHSRENGSPDLQRFSKSADKPKQLRLAISVQAGIRTFGFRESLKNCSSPQIFWIPACAGMTVFKDAMADVDWVVTQHFRFLLGLPTQPTLADTDYACY